MHTTLLVPSLLVLSLPAVLTAGSTARQDTVSLEEFEERMDAVLEEALTEGHLRGAALCIALGDRVLAQGGWGTIADRPADPEEAHPAAAWLENLAVACVLHLADEGEVDLDAPVSSYLPGLEWNGATVRVRHLLAHSSGIPAYRGSVPGHRGEPADLEGAAGVAARVKHLARYAGMLETLKAEALEHEPGTCLTYSNSNVLLLGVLVEAVTGRELHDLLPALFFEPAGLEATSFARTAEEPLPREGELEVAGETRVLNASFAALAGLELRTSAADLVRWHRALEGREVLGEASARRMLGEHLLDDGSTVAYGCGTGRTRLGDEEAVTYGGRAGSGLVHVAHYPGFDLTVALLAEGDLERAASLERRLVRLLFDLPGEGVEDRELTAEQLARYAGVFQLGCNRLAVVEEDEGLVLESALHPRHRLLYQGGHVFVAQNDHDLRLLFQVRTGEKAHAFVLDEAGTQGVAVRVPE